MRARTFRSAGWLFVAGCAAFLLALALEGEWHAAQGHRLFEQKRFGEAVYNLAKVADRPTAYQRVRGLPPMRRHLAQSLLAADRIPEAAGHYAILAKTDPADTTSQLVAAVHGWALQDRQAAIDRLQALVARRETCEPCRKAHDTFDAAFKAAEALPRARADKAKALVAIAPPAQCLTYRTSIITAKLLVIRLTDGVVSPELLRFLPARKISEKALDAIRSFLSDELRRLVDAAADNVASLEKSCTGALELPDLPPIGGVDVSGKIQDWLNLVPYIKDGKHVAADLRGIMLAAVDFSSAYLEEWNSEQAIAVGNTYVTEFWERLRREASDPGFVVTGVEGMALPPQPSLWQSLRDKLGW